MFKKPKIRELNNNADGFTILELIIATAIATGAILLLMLGALSISTGYTKGLTVAETQNTARNVISTISQSIQFGDPTVINIYTDQHSLNSNSSGWFCANNAIFGYTLGQEVSGTEHALVEAPLTASCPTSIISSQPNCNLTTATSDANVVANCYPGSQEQELLGTNMRLAYIQVWPESTSNTYQISITVAYGNNSVLQGSPTYYDTSYSTNTVKCIGKSGNQFCAIASFQTYVEPRIVN